MWLIGCTSHGCWPHQEWSRRQAQAQWRKGEVFLTPAIAAGLTDHVWSVRELLVHRLPPLPGVAPKRRGRPRTSSVQATTPSPLRRRPLLRLRKGVFCPSTRERCPTTSSLLKMLPEHCFYRFAIQKQEKVCIFATIFQCYVPDMSNSQVLLHKTLPFLVDHWLTRFPPRTGPDVKVEAERPWHGVRAWDPARGQ